MTFNEYLMLVRTYTEEVQERDVTIKRTLSICRYIIGTSGVVIYRG